MSDTEYEPTMSVSHGWLSFHAYEIDPDGRERAVYVTDWEAPGSYIEDAL